MEGVSVCLSVCLTFLRLSRQSLIRSTSRLVGVLLRTKGGAASSVKLFGWAVLQKVASSTTGCRTVSTNIKTFFLRTEKCVNIRNWTSDVWSDSRSGWLTLPDCFSLCSINTKFCFKKKSNADETLKFGSLQQKNISMLFNTRCGMKCSSGNWEGACLTMAPL